MIHSSTAFLDPPRAGPTSGAREDDDPGLLESLRCGSDSAFTRVVERYHPAMVRLAMSYVRDRATAEEVAQEAWLAFLRSLDRFRAGAPLKRWLFGILANCARNRARRERRGWAYAPAAIGATPPDDVVLWAEVGQRLEAAIASLPAAQRAVVVLRDVQGCSAEHVCERLAVSPANQRVLLHRGRARVRALLAEYVASAS